MTGSAGFDDLVQQTTKKLNKVSAPPERMALESLLYLIRKVYELAVPATDDQFADSLESCRGVVRTWPAGDLREMAEQSIVDLETIHQMSQAAPV